MNANDAGVMVASLCARLLGKGLLTLTECQEILEALISEYPEALPREVLASYVEASPASSGFANNLGALRSLGFIDYPQRGLVAAAPVLFIDEAAGL